jgi:hypothetical protein
MKTTPLSKLRDSFKSIGLKVNLGTEKIGLDQQYYYSNIITIEPDGLTVFKTNSDSNPVYDYEIFEPDGDELGSYENFDQMFDALVYFIINHRLATRFKD